MYIRMKTVSKKFFAVWMICSVIAWSAAPGFAMARESVPDKKVVSKKTQQVDYLKYFSDSIGKGKEMTDKFKNKLNINKRSAKQNKSFSRSSNLSVDKKMFGSLVEGRDFKANQVIVKFKNNKVNLRSKSSKNNVNKLIGKKGVFAKEIVAQADIVLLDTEEFGSVENAVEQLKGNANIESVQPNYIYETFGIETNDTFKDELWGLHNELNDADIDAPEAWEYLENKNVDDIIVAVIDQGVDYNHPDLRNMMWNGATCVDHDGVFVGDCKYGYTYLGSYTDNDQFLSGMHGTLVAGVIAAEANNNIGILGVSQNTKIMALSSGLTTIDNVAAINFAKNNGAKIINASWGGYGEGANDQMLYEAIESFPGLFIASSGNGTQDGDQIGDDHESVLRGYPCDFELDNIICVGATDSNDELTVFSDYGVNSVDVAAPGENIKSTYVEINDEFIYVLSEDFEDLQSNNFELTGDWNIDEGVSWFGNELYTNINIPYESNTISYATSQQYDLSSFDSNYMYFFTACDTEYEENVLNDYLTLEFSVDGENFDSILEWDEFTLDNRFPEANTEGEEGFSIGGFFQKIPLEYRTDSFAFRYKWETNGENSGDMGLGCLVDDIEILGQTNDREYKYGNVGGTSFSAPHVAGLASLIYGAKQGITALEVKNIIEETGDILPSLDGKIKTGKRINAYNAVSALFSDNTNLLEVLFNGQTENFQIEVDSNSTEYTVLIDPAQDAAEITFALEDKNATFIVNGGETMSAGDIYEAQLVDSVTEINAIVTAEDKIVTKEYIFFFQKRQVENIPPVAVDDQIDVAEKVTTEFGVLDNDEDVDGGFLEIVEIPTSDNAIIDLKDIGGEMQIVYTPNEGFIGTDIFTYTITDGIDTDEGEVTVNVIAKPTVEFVSPEPGTWFNDDFIVGYNVSQHYPLDHCKINIKNKVDGEWVISDEVLEGECFPKVEDIIVSVGLGEQCYSQGEKSCQINIQAIDTLGQESKTKWRQFSIDYTGPVITLNGAEVVDVVLGEEYIEQGATAVDNIDGVVDVVVNNSAVDIHTIGEYEVTYKAEDALGNVAETKIRTVRIVEEVNIPPTSKDVEYHLLEDESFDFVLPASDEDGEVVQIHIGTLPEHGALVQTGMASFTYTPDANFNGFDGLTYTSEDDKGARSVIGLVEFNVEAVNDAPVLELIEDANIYEGDEYKFEINVTDVDGDVVFINVGEKNTGLIPEGFRMENNVLYFDGDFGIVGYYTFLVSVTDNIEIVESSFILRIKDIIPEVTVNSLVTQNTRPALTGTIDDNTAIITVSVNGVEYNVEHNENTWELIEGTIDPELEIGIYDVVVKATDTFGNIGVDTTVDELEIVEEPVNNAPILHQIGEKSVNEGEELIFAITAEDSDVDDYMISAENMPEGSLFVNEIFSWTPNFEQAGTYEVTFTVIDDGDPALSDSEIVTITVEDVNRAPVFEDVANKTVEEETALQFVLAVSDLDGDELSVVAEDVPNGAVFNADTLTFDWTPTDTQAGQYTVKFIVTDNGNPILETEMDIVITVTDKPVVQQNNGGSSGGGGGGTICRTRRPKDVSLSVVANSLNFVSNTVKIAVTATNTPTKIAVSTDETFKNASWVNFSDEYTYSFDKDFEGTMTVYVKLKNSCNQSDVEHLDIEIKKPEVVQQVLGTKITQCSLDIYKAYKTSNSKGVYYVTEQCKKRAFTSASRFFMYFDSWDEVSIVSKGELDNIPNDEIPYMPRGPKYTPKNGSLMKSLYGNKVYVVLNGIKRWVTTAEVFTGLGYSFDWIEDVDQRLLDNLNTGEDLVSFEQLPLYSSVKKEGDSKVYRIEKNDNDMVVWKWMSTRDVFDSYKYRWDRIVIVPETYFVEIGEKI
jgi:subtilisin family serine protease